MKTISFIRQKRYVWLVCLAVLINPRIGDATDGQPILELGIVSWLTHQKMQLTADVLLVQIQDRKLDPSDFEISIYQSLIFENLDETSHVLVFSPGLNNLMEKAYTSAVIGAGERWGIEFHGFGVFPYHCTIHPEEQGSIKVVL